MQSFISICIPAYKRVNYLTRLLESIAIQTYKNFEVIISDDSPDNSVYGIVKNYSGKINISYFKNERSLGTPANWNFAISKAKGAWIKLMHDDDWFTSENSLNEFVKHTETNNKFIFSAYTNVFENTEQKPQNVFMRFASKKIILKEPAILFAENVIGPPSVTLIHSSIKDMYDERLKWRVDQEFYMRILKLENSFSYIDQTLVNIGISESQVTQSCLYNPDVELPEGFILLEKSGTKQLKNIRVYDAWWRLLRNMNIYSEKKLREYVNKNWPKRIIRITDHLSKTPKALLNIGVFSKIFMSISYLFNSSKKK
jgi:glycosyltransferase involved in cell wall biosynthesis